MSKSYAPCEVELEIGDGMHLCKLTLKGIAELQEKCGAGIGEIYLRVFQGTWKAEDLVETVRLALIGGGMDGPDARKMMNRYLDKWPMEAWLTHAKAILLACIHGYEEPKSGKQVEGAGTDGSTSQPPTPSGSEKD